MYDHSWRSTLIIKNLASAGLLVLVFVILLFSLGCQKAEKKEGLAVASEMKKWPFSIPCRTQNGENRDLFVMTLGEVKTSLAQGYFDPILDKVTLADGTEIADYYKEKLQIKYFTVLDKSAFPLPPSGWCSWYYYYQGISEEEIKKNALWLSENLKDFGAVYCQIDDGWQGKGHGSGDNRDWTTIDKRFPSGMDKLAISIKSLGLKPGLWLAPHGQSNSDVVNKSGAFLIGSDGQSLSSTWEGEYLLDPSKPEATNYLKNLFQTLSQTWGYEYFKIDGQPIVINEFKSKLELMQNPESDAEDLYRKTLQAIREAIGSSRYLLGCWGIPLQGVGIMNGSRTGGDVLIPWEGFEIALWATMKYYFLHNIAWYCDPDTMLVRYPLTLDMARAWATLQGLTGQALMTSDRLYDLPQERVDILKRVFPALDIRPLDLFPSEQFKRIWDLKIRHLSRDYDVVGCFNFDQNKADGIALRWKDLGLPEDSLVHVYDFWNKEYLGCWEKGMYVPLQPASCRTLTLLEAKNRPQLISTSRHITQGWIDLKELAYDTNLQTFRGKSSVIKNDPYELRFVFPRKGMPLRIKAAKVKGQAAEVRNFQGWATVSFTPSSTTDVLWDVTFEPAPYYKYVVQAPRNIRPELVGLDTVFLQWDPLYDLNAGYLVYLNEAPYLYTPLNQCEISSLAAGSDHIIQIYGVWLDGTVSEKSASIKLRLDNLMPSAVALSEYKPTVITSGWGKPVMNRAISGFPLQIGRKIYPQGIGTHAVSEIIYPLGGMFSAFESEVGIDAHSSGKKGSVEFMVYGDEKLLWRSGKMKKGDAAKPLRLNMKGVKVLRLYVDDAGDGIDSDHADWAAARLLK